MELSSPETIYGIIDSRYDISICNLVTKPQSRHHNNSQTSANNQNLNQNNVVSVNKTSNSTATSPTSNQSETELSNISEEPSYENINIDLPPKNKVNPLTSKDSCSVSYENLNMDYIKKLVSEGYSKDSVIKALGITRNNIDMACDILHEFGTKHG